MAKIIEAKAILSGEDKLSPMLAQLSKKFEQIRKTAKTGEAVGKTADALARVNGQLKAIEKFNSAKIGFVNARRNFREAEKAVQAAARAMKEAGAPARDLERIYNRTQRAVKAAAAAFDTQKTAFIGARSSLRDAGIPINGIAAAEERLAAAIKSANTALNQQHKTAGRLRTGIGNVVRNFGFLAGPAIIHGTKEAVKSGAEIQSEVVKMRAAGIPEEDIQRELGRSATLAKKYPNVKRSDILERYKETRSVLLHPEEASHLLETVVKANAAMNAIDTSGHAAEGLQFAIKGAEVLGLAQDPKRFEAYLNSFIKAQQVMGKTITAEQMFDFAKYTKASGSTLSDRFKMTTGVSLAQEMGGSTTGVSIDQFVKQITGGFQGNLHSAAKEFIALGLAKKEDFERTKTGNIKGMKPGRHVKGYELAQTDPDRYVSEILLPALVSHGFKDQNAQIAQVRRMFPSTRAADLVAKLITQAPSFENHAKLYEKAQGMEAIKNNESDPFVGLNALTTSLKSFAGTVTSPIMEKAAQAMSGMASWIGGMGEAIAQWQKENPTTAKVAAGGAIGVGAVGGGILTYNLISGLMNGFGLPKSALALDGSAAALMKAAKALGGAALAEPASKAPKSANAGWMGIATRIIGTAAGAGLIYFGSTEEANAGEGEIYKKNPWTGKMEMTPYGRSLQPAPADTSEKPRPTFSDRFGDWKSSPVQAELKGEAKVTGEATINLRLPDGTIQRVNVPLRGTVSANGPGSLGTSSPDAAAPSGAL